MYYTTYYRLVKKGGKQVSESFCNTTVVVGQRVQAFVLGKCPRPIITSVWFFLFFPHLTVLPSPSTPLPTRGSSVQIVDFVHVICPHRPA